MTTALLRFEGHGLGDACQFTIIIRHLKKHYPEWEIITQTPCGTQDLFRGLADHAEPLKQPWRWRAEKEIYFHWQRAKWQWLHLPSSKVTMCLLEGDLRTHGIEPDLSLWRYHCSSTEEQQERVDQWAGDQAYVLYHYLGHSCPEKKNLTPEDMEPYINKAIELGLKPVAMDWSGGDPFVADGRAKGIQEFWLKDPHSLNHYSDAGIIYEIIKNAEMLVGIDSGVEHIAGATSTPTAVIWRDFHPYFNFDPYVDEDRKTEDGYLTSDLTHFIKKGAVPLAPESQECFESLYAFKEYISPWELFETTLPKMLEEVVQ